MTGDPHRFTGKQRDPETAFDYFEARYYRNVWGRLATVDPVMDKDQNRADPQQWNRYAYARNNPLRFVDPTGEAIQLMGSTEEERNLELAGIRASLVNSAVADRLYINMVEGRYFVGIRGDVGEFAKAGSLEADLAEVIGFNDIVQFSLAKR